MQATARVGAEADDIARVGRNLRLVQDDVEHLAASVSPCRDSLTGGAHNCPMTAESNAVLPGSLASRFCGLNLASPIVLLSGCVGFGEEYTRVEGFSNRDVGAIVLKGTTAAARLGNAPHRVYETSDGMLNAIGLQNPGVDYVVREILPALDFSETRFIANVCGSTIEEYVEVTRRFDDSPIDAIEINISCPNVKEGGVQFGNVPEMSGRVVAACRRVTRKPSSPNSRPTRPTSARTRGAASRPAPMRSRSSTPSPACRSTSHPAAGDRQRAGRPFRTGHQADRAAQGQGSVRSGRSRRHPDHRPGRHRQRA